MTIESAFLCSCCGQQHEQSPFSYAASAPAYWRKNLENDPNSMLSSDQCVINGAHFFIRAQLVLPIHGSTQEFEWGVWVSLSHANFFRAGELWTDPQRIKEPPYFGWLATELPSYEPTTLKLKTKVHSQPVGVRPTVELQPTDHPLAIEQRTGIDLARVQHIAELLLHPRQ